MPWTANAPNFGFSSGRPWLPTSESHRPLAVDVQESDRRSALAFTRRCLALRRSNSALRSGALRIVEASERKLVFDRIAGEQHLRCTFNLSDEGIPHASAGETLIASGAVADHSLGPYAAVIEVIE